MRFEGELLRVIMVTPGFYPIKGGTEVMVQSLATELNRIGVHTDVMTFNMDQKWVPKWRGKTERMAGFTLFKIPALNWLPIEHTEKITLDINLIPGRFTHILKKYDIIHFHEVDYSFPLFSFLLKKPKIFHLHGIDPSFHKTYRLPKLILKSVADYYISISKQMKTDLVGLGIPRERIAYLPNGVDTKIFCPNGVKKDNLILFVGRIELIKGLHVLLRSLSQISKPVNLVIIGPADWDLYYFKSIMRSMENENLRGRHKITYLGPQSRAEVVKWYQRASILVAPSLGEAFPLVDLEALSCETPVIATPVGGVPEIVQNYENGILVPPNDHIKLTEAIQYLLENKDLRIRMGQEGRKWVNKNFSLETITQRLRNIYKHIIAN